VQDEPAELSCDLVAGWLRRHWAVAPVEVSYAPVGFGGYHWVGVDDHGGRWFVTVNHLDPDGNWLGSDPDAAFDTLSAAAGTTRALAAQGFRFAVAPVPDQAGVLVRRVLPGWAMQVFPYLEGWRTADGSWQDPKERTRIAAVVGRLHAAAVPSGVPRWTFVIPCWSALTGALDDLARPWTGGPYAERTRMLLTDTQQSIRARRDRYDALAAGLAASADAWVVTHGEPGSANVIRTRGGSMHLIDWDTVAVAPRERDLVHILDGSAEVLAAYQRTAGPVTPRPAALELFTLRWALADICEFVQVFRHPHEDSADTAESWRSLCHDAHQVSST
jgi:spectinomycin phosphotransferase